MAVCTSAAVLVAGAVGAFTPAVAAAAVVAACVIAALSFHGAGGRVVAQDLAPLGEDLRGPVTVNAPRASEVAGPAGRQTDAA